MRPALFALLPLQCRGSSLFNGHVVHGIADRYRCLARGCLDAELPTPQDELAPSGRWKQFTSHGAS